MLLVAGFRLAAIGSLLLRRAAIRALAVVVFAWLTAVSQVVLVGRQRGAFHCGLLAVRSGRGRHVSERTAIVRLVVQVGRHRGVLHWAASIRWMDERGFGRKICDEQICGQSELFSKMVRRRKARAIDGNAFDGS